MTAMAMVMSDDYISGIYISAMNISMVTLSATAMPAVAASVKRSLTWSAGPLQWLLDVVKADNARRGVFSGY